MFPAPTTIATSTPWSRTALTCRATAATRSGSVPYSSSPISASPESFSSMRLKAGAIAGQSLYPPKSLLAYGEAREPADDHILAGGRRELIAQLLDGPAIELGVVHLLLEQHDRRQPRVQLAGHDSLAHVLRLLSGLQLVDARLRLALLRGDVLAADVPDGRRGGDLHGHLAGERHEVLVLGHEVRVAVHLDQQQIPWTTPALPLGKPLPPLNTTSLAPKTEQRRSHPQPRHRHRKRIGHFRPNPCLEPSTLDRTRLPSERTRVV